MNMPRRQAGPNFGPYRPFLEKWMPNADIRLEFRLGTATFDGLLAWKNAGQTIRYLIEEKRHLRYQDVGVVVDQLARLRTALPHAHANDRLLLLAPHVRPQQAAVLERAEIDYLDLAGNVHLQAPGLLVHVEGRRPTTEHTTAVARPHKAWIKVVLALLVRPDGVNQPYRFLATEADVALGTVAACIKDLTARGLLLEGKEGRRVTDLQALVALWVQAYIEGLRPKLQERRLQVRADTKQDIWTRLKTVLAEKNHRWALTGADAAYRRTRFFRAEETEIYAPVDVFDDRELQKALVAQPVARAGNLLVIEPPGPLAIPDHADVTDDLPIAPTLLAYAELQYRGTNQALEAAEILLPHLRTDGTH